MLQVMAEGVADAKTFAALTVAELDVSGLPKCRWFKQPVQNQLVLSAGTVFAQT
jgi:hypothetical protein